ncbi:MAG TPA: hypothetical protein EYI98_05815 [Candidatus Marinimicrobia bacterium]|nr:hypothetical protein [Candidatus Neomarinimicrobiota bacterium]
MVLALVIGTVGHSQDSTVSDPDPKRFQSQIDQFLTSTQESLLPDSVVLFIGSSSIRLWELDQYFPDYNALNRGFGGAHISDMLHYIDVIINPYSVKAVVFYCGDNDISSGKTPDHVYNDFLRIYDKIISLFPAVKFYYIPIKPSISRWGKWDNMNQTNHKILTLSKWNSALYYVNTATPMLEIEGTPNPKLFIEDGLHLNVTGYDLWTKIVRDRIAQTLD